MTPPIPADIPPKAANPPVATFTVPAGQAFQESVARLEADRARRDLVASGAGLLDDLNLTVDELHASRRQAAQYGG